MSEWPADTTREEHRAWQAERWQVLGQLEHERTASMTHDERVDTLSTLMATAYELGWDAKMHDGKDQVRAMWQEYRERWHVQNPTV